MLRRALRRLALVVGVVVLTDQVLQYTIFRDGVVRGLRVAPFDPPLFGPSQRSRLERMRTDLIERPKTVTSTRLDAELGWAPNLDPETTPRGRFFSYDERGLRRSRVPLAARPAQGVRRVVAIGCSFTRGDEVAGDECWVGRLSDEREDLEIANLGMGGYGLDQALLRLERDGLSLGPQEVWLGLLPRAALRNATHFTALANHWVDLAYFKPRFVLTGDAALVLRPNPAPDLATTVALLSDQEAFLQAVGPDDPWVSRAPRAFAPAGDSWMHHSAFLRAWLTWRASGGNDPAVELQDPGNVHRRLLLALVRRTAEVTEAAGARFRLLVLPDRRDLAAAEVGMRYWAPVVAELRSGGIEVFEVTDRLLALGVHREDRFWARMGHYSSEANALVAEAIAEAWFEEK